MVQHTLDLAKIYLGENHGLCQVLQSFISVVEEHHLSLFEPALRLLLFVFEGRMGQNHAITMVISQAYIVAVVGSGCTTPRARFLMNKYWSKLLQTPETHNTYSNDTHAVRFPLDDSSVSTQMQEALAAELGEGVARGLLWNLQASREMPDPDHGASDNRQTVDRSSTMEIARSHLAFMFRHVVFQLTLENLRRRDLSLGLGRHRGTIGPHGESEQSIEVIE